MRKSFIFLVATLLFINIQSLEVKKAISGVGSVGSAFASYYCFKKVNELKSIVESTFDSGDMHKAFALERELETIRSLGYVFGIVSVASGLYACSNSLQRLGILTTAFALGRGERAEELIEEGFEVFEGIENTFADRLDFPLYCNGNPDISPVRNAEGEAILLPDWIQAENYAYHQNYLESIERAWNEEALAVTRVTDAVRAVGTPYTNSDDARRGMSSYCFIREAGDPHGNIDLEDFRYHDLDVNLRQAGIRRPVHTLQDKLKSISLLEYLILNYLPDALANRDLPIHYVSLGSWGGFQDYTFICLLLKLGFTDIRAHLVEPFFALEAERGKVTAVNNFRQRLEDRGVSVYQEPVPGQPRVSVACYTSYPDYVDFIAENPEQKGKIFIGRNMFRMGNDQMTSLRLFGFNEERPYVERRVGGTPLGQLPGVHQAFGCHYELIYNLMIDRENINEESESIGLDLNFQDSVKCLYQGRACPNLGRDGFISI